MKEQNEQEKELRNALRKIYDDINIPDSTESWNSVQQRLKRRKKRLQWQRRMRIGIAVVIISFAFNLVYNMSIPTAYSHIATLIKKWQEDVVEFFHERPSHSDRNALTSSPPGNRELSSSSDMMHVDTLDEAQEIISFDLLTPYKIPKTFQLDAVRIFGVNEAQLEYVNMNGEVLNIIQRKIEGEPPDLKATMSADSGEYKDVYINGVAAILMIPIEGNMNLEWLTEERILVRISGQLSEDVIVNLADSMK